MEWISDTQSRTVCYMTNIIYICLHVTFGYSLYKFIRSKIQTINICYEVMLPRATQ